MKEPEIDTYEDSPGSDGPALMSAQPYLFLVLECDRPTSGGARYSLAGVDEVLIGRASERAAKRDVVDGAQRLTIGVPGRSMSSTHARLMGTADGFVLEDAHSTNGSFLNGQRTERALLREGDVVELGHALFRFREALKTPPGTAETFDSRENPPQSRGLSTLLPALAAEFATLARFAQSNLPLLLLGDTGTGKEVVARAMHDLSKRKGPFVAVNCGALAPNLVESQLFGHVKGSFSGATRDEPGFVRAADGGSLLLDELGDLPPIAQPALLRVLQEREVVPVGAARPVSVDVRVIAATHRPLDKLVAQDRYRKDLLGRLDGCRLRLPTLEERGEDLGIIISEILSELGAGDQIKVTPEAGLALMLRGWRFNVRELVQVLQRALLIADKKVITRAHIPDGGAYSASTAGGHSSPPLSPADVALRRELVMKLEEHHGNVADVARAMGKARMQIHRWVQRLEIDVEPFRSGRRE